LIGFHWKHYNTRPNQSATHEECEYTYYEVEAIIMTNNHVNWLLRKSDFQWIKVDDDKITDLFGGTASLSLLTGTCGLYLPRNK